MRRPRHAKSRSEAKHRRPNLLVRLRRQLGTRRSCGPVKARSHFRQNIREAASGSSAGSDRTAGAPDDEDGPAGFTRGDEVAAVAAERRGRHRDAALHDRGMAGDHVNPARIPWASTVVSAWLREHRDQELVPEMPGRV
jgi:hypothetical protein